MDAHALALAPNTTGNVIVFDVLHHLQRPLDFLRRAVASIKPGGRLVVCEPALSPWSRFVYGVFHHEPVDDKWDLFGLDGQPPHEDLRHEFAKLPFLNCCSGGTGKVPRDYWSPAARACAEGWISSLSADRRLWLSKLRAKHRLRDLAKARGSDMRPFADWLTGMRMIVVFEKPA